MEIIDRIKRLDALRAAATGDRAEAERVWFDGLDEDAQRAYLDKWETFHQEELGIDIYWWWDETTNAMIDPIPEAFNMAMDAVIAYSHALYKAALAREALKALKEP